MKIDSVSGLVEGARYMPSPNCDERPDGALPEVLVLHSISLPARRNGEVVQFVPLHQRAWHAGQSCCDGRTRVNDFSIGIELEGADDLPFEDAQYESLG